DRVTRQPIVELVFRRLTGEDLKPRDFLLAAIRFLDRRIEHAYTCGPNVRPSAIATDKWNDWTLRHIEFVGLGNLFTGGRGNIFVRHKASIVVAGVSPAIPCSGGFRQPQTI